MNQPGFLQIKDLQQIGPGWLVSLLAALARGVLGEQRSCSLTHSQGTCTRCCAAPCNGAVGRGERSGANWECGTSDVRGECQRSVARGGRRRNRNDAGGSSDGDARHVLRRGRRSPTRCVAGERDTWVARRVHVGHVHFAGGRKRQAFRHTSADGVVLISGKGYGSEDADDGDDDHQLDEREAGLDAFHGDFHKLETTDIRKDRTMGFKLFRVESFTPSVAIRHIAAAFRHNGYGLGEKGGLSWLVTTDSAQRHRAHS